MDLLEKNQPIARLTSMTSTPLTPSISASFASSGSVLPSFSSMTKIISNALRPNAIGLMDARFSPASPTNSSMRCSACACTATMSTSGLSGIILTVTIAFAIRILVRTDEAALARELCRCLALVLTAHYVVLLAFRAEELYAPCGVRYAVS